MLLMIGATLKGNMIKATFIGKNMLLMIGATLKGKIIGATIKGKNILPKR